MSHIPRNRLAQGIQRGVVGFVCRDEAERACGTIGLSARIARGTGPALDAAEFALWTSAADNAGICFAQKFCTGWRSPAIGGLEALGAGVIGLIGCDETEWSLSRAEVAASRSLRTARRAGPAWKSQQSSPAGQPPRILRPV